MPSSIQAVAREHSRLFSVDCVRATAAIVAVTNEVVSGQTVPALMLGTANRTRFAKGESQRGVVPGDVY
jgi:hypothetical protein